MIDPVFVDIPRVLYRRGWMLVFGVTDLVLSRSLFVAGSTVPGDDVLVRGRPNN